MHTVQVEKTFQFFFVECFFAGSGTNKKWREKRLSPNPFFIYYIIYLSISSANLLVIRNHRVVASLNAEGWLLEGLLGSALAIGRGLVLLALVEREAPVPRLVVDHLDLLLGKEGIAHVVEVGMPLREVDEVAQVVFALLVGTLHAVNALDGTPSQLTEDRTDASLGDVGECTGNADAGAGVVVGRGVHACSSQVVVLYILLCLKIHFNFFLLVPDLTSISILNKKN